MTRSFIVAVLVTLCATWALFAQDSSAPSPLETPSPSPSASISATRSVPLRFIPPPMEGTVSLGIWDSNDKLVRVLHQEAKIDSFATDEDSLKTTWDGKNDAGEDLAPGKYRARGYLVGKIKIDDIGKVASPPGGVIDHLPVKLVPNPLTSDTRAVMEVAVGFDAKGSFLKTTDGLPLATIKVASNLSRVAIERDGDKAANVWQEDASGTEHLRVWNIDKMMAFDCGFFELK